jgi:TolA-binding protein
MRRLIGSALMVAAFAVGPATHAMAQIDSREGIALDNEILELRQHVQQLEQQMSGLQQLQTQAGVAPAPVPAPMAPMDSQGQAGPAPAGDALAQLVVRVSALEEEMRTLKGRVEELANTEQHDHDDLAKQIGDLAFKINPAGATPGGTTPGMASPDAGAQGEPSGMEPPPGFLSPTPAPAPPPAQMAPTPVHHTPEQALKLGQAALARRDYDTAAAAAQEVIAAGHGPRIADAEYLLAHAEAGKHNYKAAAAAFYGVYKASPRGPRAAASLLGVANAFLDMGDNPHACETLVKFNAEYPHPDSTLRGEVGSMRKRGGC